MGSLLVQDLVGRRCILSLRGSPRYQCMWVTVVSVYFRSVFWVFADLVVFFVGRGDAHFAFGIMATALVTVDALSEA